MEKWILISVNEASDLLGMPHWTVRKLIKNKVLRFVTIGRKIYLLKSEVIEYKDRLIKSFESQLVSS